MIEAIHQNTRMPRREIVRYLVQDARQLVSKKYRDKLVEEDHQFRLHQLRDFEQRTLESGYAVPEDIISEITRLEQKLQK